MSNQKLTNHEERIRRLEEAEKKILPLTMAAWREEQQLNKVRKLKISKDTTIRKVVSEQIRRVFPEFSYKTIADYEQTLIQILLDKVD